MSKFFFLLLMALLFFLGGMYLYLPLLVVFVAMALLAVFCLIMSRYFHRHLKVEFFKHSEVCQVHADTSLTLVIHYTGRWPTGTVRIPLRMSWGKRRKHRLTTVRQMMEKKGDLSVPFQVRPVYCGLLSISFQCFRTCDYLSLFRPKKRQADTMELAVFPGEEALQLEFSTVGEEESIQPETQQQNRPGDTSMEIRQLREYQEGDSMRQIHWNLSARMDDLWVKEFQRESDSSACVLLDGRGAASLRAADAGCFYELISALVLGLLKHVSAVALGWKELGKEALILKEIRDPDECREALLSLYRSSLAEDLPAAPEDMTGLFLVDPELRISLNSRVLRQFSRKDLENEISREVLLI